jgi:hypothetical protein
MGFCGVEKEEFARRTLKESSSSLINIGSNEESHKNSPSNLNIQANSNQNPDNRYD